MFGWWGRKKDRNIACLESSPLQASERRACSASRRCRVMTQMSAYGGCSPRALQTRPA